MLRLSRYSPLEEYLSQHGVEWVVLDRDTHWALEARWERIYGKVFSLGERHRAGVRAEAEYGAERAEQYYIVSFVGSNACPYVSPVKGNVRVAYACTGNLVALGDFHTLEFFVAPPDFEWTMIHTHEDYGFGGPFFCRRRWLVHLGAPYDQR